VTGAGVLPARRATAADLDAVVELFDRYLEFYGRDLPPDDVRAFVTERFETGQSVVLVAEVDGAVVGFAQCYPTWSSLSLAPSWILNDLFVAPAGRGRGVGRALVRAVRAAATEAGAAYVELSTARTNVTAQALYESESFVRDDEFLVYTAENRG
jgi:ribosomal protein S18 acetylase RimI-like enzyme